ncbi:MAG TPA: hypothetical protein VF178_14740 [Gemmatimonadaceae bacterium]
MAGLTLATPRGNTASRPRPAGNLRFPERPHGLDLAGGPAARNDANGCLSDH